MHNFEISNNLFHSLLQTNDIVYINQGNPTILENIFDQYQLKMDLNQYVLVGSTIKSYLSYLHEENKLKFEFNKNKMLWSQN